MKRTFLVISTFALFVLLISSCFEAAPGTANTFKTPTLPHEMFDYESVDIPADVLSSFGNSFEGDFVEGDGFFDITCGCFVSTSSPSMKISNAGATLGRVLFYDKQLSLNNTVSCGSCHHQELAFADGLAKSAGFEGRRTSRNAMAIVNAGLNNNLFWDSRVQSTESLISEPIQNHIEMGMEDLVALSSKLSKLEYYPNLFKNAFGDEAINEERIADAMSQFLNSMVSFDSKFDRESNNNFAGFSTLEKAGMELFTSQRLQCQGCHSSKMFSAPDAPFQPYGGPAENGGPDTRGTANIGLEMDYEDEGRFQGQFKIPTLRNIALTGPYMHDGRFASLREVIDHYDKNIVPHPNLDSKFMQNGQTQRLNLTELEKTALLAFLGTLTDESFISDPKFSDPFN